jgi:hypothetical protein
LKTKPKTAARKPQAPKGPSPEAEAALAKLLSHSLARDFIIHDSFKTLAQDLEGELDQSKWSELHRNLTSMLLMVEVLAAFDGKPVKGGG